MRPERASRSFTADELAPWLGPLLANGYVVIRNAANASQLSAIDHDLERPFAETPLCQGGFYGQRTQRFGRLLTRSQTAQEFVLHPLILAIVGQVLEPWCDMIQLNLTQAIALHPGALAQLPHRDQDMWRGAIGETEYLVNVMWPLTPFDRDNGATLLWPASHGPAALQSEARGDPVVATIAPGDALVFLGSTLHGAGENRTECVRRGMIISYCLGWLKPYENPWLSYPPDVARDFSPELAALVGYRQHRPNLGNVEGQCPSILLSGPLDRPLGAIDALRPDQKVQVDAFVANQCRAP